MRTDYDVAIVGAGCVGAALACRLAATGMQVAMIEAREPRPFDPDRAFDLRVFALSRASQRFLDQVGVWTEIADVRVGAYDAMRVWEQDAGDEVVFEAARLAEPDLGHIVENRLIQDRLWQRMEALGVTRLAPATLADVSDTGDRVEIRLDDGRELTASLLVAADGANSETRRRAGIRVRRQAYDQTAVVAHLQPEQAHAQTAWQRFLTTGPVALLPLADGRVSLVWSTTPGHADALQAMSEAAFAAAVTEAVQGRLGALSLASDRAAFPLQRLHAEDYFAGRIAVAGDAAHVVHPLAGQGVNLGLADAAALAECLIAAAEQGRDLGAEATLARYARRRRGDNRRMLAAMDAIKRLYAVSGGPLPPLRRLGMRLFNRSDAIKSLAMRQALGA